MGSQLSPFCQLDFHRPTYINSTICFKIRKTIHLECQKSLGTNTWIQLIIEYEYCMLLLTFGCILYEILYCYTVTIYYCSDPGL
jgi:hypothetical protein